MARTIVPFGYRHERPRLLLDVSLTFAPRSVLRDVGSIAAVPRPTPYLVLVEAPDEEIRYRLSTDRDGDPTGPAVQVGPSCDRLDLRYVRESVTLPLTLADGDRVVLESAGAYTTSFSTVGFNGFPARPTALR